ncbi:unnamed protein product [Caenorhabditis auriculariae]|uniref:Uncharacterized protein n=1 Tax=Caenorhabditis auriculariae TaxID=2777116 RepID=A0A8S1HH41_9PELO|nr:unnamed protein product [Caenorhabditis auriculariae]
MTPTSVATTTTPHIPQCSCKEREKTTNMEGNRSDCKQTLNDAVAYIAVLLGFLLIVSIIFTTCLVVKFKNVLKRRNRKRDSVDECSAQNSFKEERGRNCGGEERLQEVTTDLDPSFTVLKQHVQPEEAPAQMYLSV